MKPTFIQLPTAVQHVIFQDVQWNYDPYEGSREEEIENAINGNLSERNVSILMNYYNALSEDTIKTLIHLAIESATNSIISCNDTLIKFFPVSS